MTCWARRVALWFALALTPLAVQAESILDHVPPEALGFAVVHGLADADAKIQRLMKIFEGLSEVTPPAPLVFIKASTGLGEGIDDNGDAALALLPGDADPLVPRPMFLVAVSDYGRFAESTGGDATGQIARVTIAGEEVLTARLGGYALLMNVEHRPTMERFLAARNHPPAEIAPLAEWLGTNDLAAMILPAGVDAILKVGRAAVADKRGDLEEEFRDPGFADMLAQMKLSMDIYDRMLKFYGDEIVAGAVGVAIDDATNVKVSKRLLLAPNGRLAKAGGAVKPSGSPMAGLAAAPFVVSAGGPLPQSSGEFSAKAAVDLIKQYPEVYGFEDFDDQQWNKIEESWRSTTEGVQSISMTILVGEAEDPVFSNLYFVVKVDDSAAYLASMRKSMELWNELTDASSSEVKLKYEIEDVEIDGRKSLLMVTDVAAAAADDNVPIVKPLMEAMVGPDGKMRVHALAVDEGTVAMGIASRERTAAIVQQLEAGEHGLAKSENVLVAANLLDADAPWTALVSPRGCVLWVTRFVATIMSQFGGGAAPIPEYPAGPPVGLSLRFVEDQLRGEMVAPVQALKDIAAFIKKCQAM